MPKIYSDEERNNIIYSLKEEANNLMQEKGVKKTTVDEIVKRVGIPKGTFYLFYPSKEMLLFDCAQDFHEQVDVFITEGLKKIIKENNIDLKKKGSLSDFIDDVTDVIMGGIDITQNSCLKVLLDPESMNLFLQKLPEDALEQHRKQDTSMGEDIIRSIAERKGLNAEELSGAFTMILFGGMYKQVVGEKNIDGSTRFLVRGLIKQILE